MNGLAWTEGGGEVLSLEANLSHGRGLVLTGQLGEVMRESAQAAYSYAKSRAKELEIDPEDFNNGIGQVGVRILSWREIR